MNKDQLTEYADFLLKAIMYKADSLDAAQDIVEDTLMSALEAIERGVEINDPKNWLVTVLYRKYYDRLREKYRRPTVNIDVIKELPDISDVYENIERSEEAEKIRRCLAYLSGIYRQTLVRFYMKGESVKEIALSMGISENTVKTRLKTGREHIRKEFTMEKFSANSYEPEYLSMSCSGRDSINNEPFSLVKRDDIIAQNLLILAYDKPVTVSELADAIGIACVYIEPIVEKLVRGELMKRAANKVYTDFIIYSKTDREETWELERKYADENYRKIWQEMEKGFEELSETDYYKACNERQQTKLQAYFAVRTLECAMRNIRNELTGEYNGSFEENYPDRPNGGKWFAMGHRIAREKRNNWWNGYSVNGEYDIVFKDVCVYEYGTCLSHGANLSDHFGSQANLIFYLVRHKKYESFDALSPKDMEKADTMTKNGYLCRENGCLDIDIPVLTWEQRGRLFELSDNFAAKIGENNHDMYMDIFKGRGAALPPHLKSVPEYLRYLCCGSSISMMTIMNAKDNGLFLKGVDYPTPTAYMVV